MYSTPGTSQSSFSIGFVTRSSTSLADAPGICTKTSIIGTTICGSSSRGSMRTAPTPSRIEATTTSGVSLDLMKACASFPAGPSPSLITPAPRLFRRWWHTGSGLSHSATIVHGCHAINHHLLALFQPRKHFHPVAVNLAGSHQSHACNARLVDHVDAGKLTVLDDSFLENRDGLRLASDEAGFTVETGMNDLLIAGLRRDADLDQVGSARRIRCRNDLYHYACKL